MIVKAILRSFDGGTYTATVQQIGSLAEYRAGVPVARNIAAAELVAGRIVALAVYDPQHPADAAVVAVHT